MSSTLSDLRDCDWRPALPVVGILILYALFMPWTGAPRFSSLALHQQLIALSSLPSIFGSVYWFLSANEQVLERPSPEERILDE